MGKISVIYSTDYDFQVISIIEGNSEHAWDIANEMYKDKVLEKHKIEHYDVMEFNSITDMNEWILDSVLDSRS